MYLFPGTHYEVTARWPVRLLAAVPEKHLPIHAGPLEFRSGSQPLGRWDGRELTILPGYACDGYSPVIRVCGRWLRLTPTPRAGLWPAVLHDFLRQFLATPGCPWSREDSDEWFYNALTSGGLTNHLAGTYYGAVAGPFGSAFMRLTRRPDPALNIIPI